MVEGVICVLCLYQVFIGYNLLLFLYAASRVKGVIQGGIVVKQVYYYGFVGNGHL